MTPDVLVDTDRGHPVEPTRVVDESPLAFGDDHGVRRVPRHTEASGRTRDGEVVDHDRLQRPGESTTGDLRPWRRRLRHVLPPRPPTVITPVAADPDQQRRRPVPERLVRQPADHRVAHDAFSTALPTPRVLLDDATLDDRTLRPDPLPDGFKTELVETAERSQIGRGESRLGHVEVFQMGSVGTSILEDLDPYPRTDQRTPTTPSNAMSRLTV